MRIAVLGLGRMGQALARRALDGGHDLVGWNRTRGRAADLVAAGGREADSIGAAVAGVDLVITSLANDGAVRQLALGGLRSAIPDGAVYADSSTISPDLSAELDRAFPRFVAMPILGAPAAVAAGAAGYLVGGRPEATTVVDQLLPALSAAVRHYPSPPLASTAKLTVNLLLLDELVALAESIAVGRAGGLTDDQLRELLADSPMVPAGLKNRFEAVFTGDQDPWWTTVLGAKDAGLAVDVARGAGLDLPLTRTAGDLYRRAASSGHADADIVAVAHLYRNEPSESSPP